MLLTRIPVATSPSSPVQRRPSLTQRLSRLSILPPREHPNFFGPPTPGLPPYTSPASEQRVAFESGREPQSTPSDNSLPSTESIIDTLYPPNRPFARDTPDFRELSATFTTGQSRRRNLNAAASPLRNEVDRQRRELQIAGLGIHIGPRGQNNAPVLPETPVGDGLGESIFDALNVPDISPPSPPRALSTPPPRVLSTPPPRSSAERPTPAPPYTSHRNPPGLYVAPRHPTSSNARDGDRISRRRAAFQVLGAMQEHSELINVPRAPRLPSGPIPSPYIEQAAQEGWYEPPPAYGPHCDDPVFEVHPGVMVTYGGSREHPRIGYASLDPRAEHPYSRRHRQ